MYLIIGAEGNEYGITNVSSQGRVSITVVPPRQQASRSRSQTPFDHDFKSSVPPATASNFAGNVVETSSYSQVVNHPQITPSVCPLLLVFLVVVMLAPLLAVLPHPPRKNHTEKTQKKRRGEKQRIKKQFIE